MSRWRHEDDLRALPEALTPEPAERQRVRQRLQASLEEPRRAPWRLALAGLVATAAGVGLFIWFQSNEDLQLNSPEAWAEAELSRGVDLHFQGRGLASGPTASPTIRWDEGEIALAVPPGQGLDLRVQTPEAEVLVVGTRFSVSRDARGTTVAVSEGRVSVTCVDGTARFLVPEQRLSCPRSAAATLSLVRDLERAQASPAEILDLLQRALARPDADEVERDEIRYRMVSALEALGRAREAREVAEEALRAGTSPRAAALLATAARLAVAEGDCAAAIPHLRRLTAEQADPVALVMLADCLAPSDTAGAREALEAALEAPLDAAQRERVEARLRVLGAGGR